MPRRSSLRHPARRGIVARLLAVLLGVAVAGGGIVVMQLPLLRRPTNVRVTLNAIVTPASAAPIAWPSVGSAALVIPSLGVAEGHDDTVVPIASLTKLMTAYVALQRLPLGPEETGPCHVVTSDDVTTYGEMTGLDESSVPVAVGEQLCESDLLNGLLVHSSGNYAVMLADMVAGDETAFIALMNEEAVRLGLAGTHYDDVTGFSPESVSTALDQAKLAALLMRSALVRSIVIQPSVVLPVAGRVNSYTPYVGVDGVIGVKSGRTAEAGGCDVMAMTFQAGSSSEVVYAVVLGQRGGDLLGPAGDAALALAQSAVAGELHQTFARGSVIGHLTYDGRHVDFGLASTHEVFWWPAQGPLRLSVAMDRLRGRVRRGEVIGRLYVRGTTSAAFELRAFGDLTPLTLLQRLR